MTVSVCRWCGAEISPEKLAAGARYCKLKHSTRWRDWRNRQRSHVAEPCPTPDKKWYFSRGEAIAAGGTRNRRPYLCECGNFHLTSHRGGKAMKLAESDADACNTSHASEPD